MLRAPPKNSPNFALAVALLFALTLAAGALTPPALAQESGPKPMAADVSIFAEDFEGVFPGGTWNVTDVNPANGTDTWGKGGYRTYAGASGVWAGGVGSQVLNWTGSGPAEARPFADGLENVTLAPTWNSSDADPTDGDDTWNMTSIRKHNGTQSMWCAQDGNNSVFGELNSLVYYYDNSQDSIVWRDVNLTGLAAINATSATLEFYYFTLSEQGIDFLLVDYYDGVQWVALASWSGDSNGWQLGTADVPTSATRIGFRFTSDAGGVFEGVYVDDVRLYASHDEPNVALRTYDASMSANMSRAVDLSAYTSGNLSYHYWLDAQSPGDALTAGYFAGGAWTYLDSHTGNSSGWQVSNITVPKNATRVGFRFVSDATVQREGAYLDDIRLTGHVLDLLCSAGVSQTTGYENTTTFTFTATATQGLPPFGWSWNFTDGGTWPQQNRSRTFSSVGTYVGNFTVTDAAGQSCTAVAPAVTVVHDTTVVSVSAAALNILEGETVAVSGFDHWNHPFALNWTMSSPSCGNFSALNGAVVNFTAALDAGDTTCTIRGAFGAVNDTVDLNIDHDLTTIQITPPAPTVIEGGSVAFSATDANGHALDFVWAVSVGCGNLSVRVGPATVLNATGEGGMDCRVAVSLDGHVAVANVTLLHDNSIVSLFPTSGQLVEGGSMEFRALDRYAHTVEAAWSLSPAGCGALSTALGNNTTFTAATSAGGSNCTVSALVGGTVTLNAVLTVTHDISVLTLQAGATELVEGAAASFGLLDANSHPYAGSWTVTPVACGNFSSQQAGSVTFTAASTAGGINCTITAAVGANLWRANVSVIHGPPASVLMAQNNLTVLEGGSLTLSASVKDAAGHTRAGLEVNWTSACASVATTPAVSTSVLFPETAGGTTCTVTASYGTLSATATIDIQHEGPYTLSVEPSSSAIGGGATQVFTATVVDAHGHGITNATVQWSSSCGALSSTSGYSVTYTAPSDLGGSSCTVSAKLAGTSAAEVSSPVTTAGSMLLPIAIVVPIALGAVGFLVWRAKRPKQPPPSGPEQASAPVEEAKPTFEVDIR